MIAYLKGNVILIQNNHIILEVSGVGYKVGINDKIAVKAGDPLELFVYNHIREDCNDLYGFLLYDELLLFEKLITVSGVGPKVGLLILNISDTNSISEAIIKENIAFFQAIPGIGKKVAAKIILELKSKLTGLQTQSIIGHMNDSNDLIEALMSLGYKGYEISRTVALIPQDVTGTENKIRWCLKHMKKI